MHEIGMMQGRLTQPKGRGIQFFPFDYWEQEFEDAKKAGLSEIEFIFDYERYAENPLWTKEGTNRLADIQESTGVKVRSVCFDYFMRRPFFKWEKEERALIRKENTQIISNVLAGLQRIGATLIEIPLVDDSSLKNDEEKELFREWLLEIIEDAPAEILFGLETDLCPQDFLPFILSFENERVGANYDSGNSSGIGYNLYEEVTTLREHIFNIHIKDRVYQGTTVKLGTGSADFEKLFKGLREIDYKGNFILQAARADEGKELDNIKEQMAFVQGYIQKVWNS